MDVLRTRLYFARKKKEGQKKRKVARWDYGGSVGSWSCFAPHSCFLSLVEGGGFACFLFGGEGSILCVYNGDIVFEPRSFSLPMNMSRLAFFFVSADRCGKCCMNSLAVAGRLLWYGAPLRSMLVVISRSVYVRCFDAMRHACLWRRGYNVRVSEYIRQCCGSKGLIQGYCHPAEYYCYTPLMVL